MKNVDVVVVGELNVDLILNQIEAFPEVGKEIMAKEMSVTLGSSSAIFASNISSLGAFVTFIGKIGKDNFGNLVLQSLGRKGVDTTLIKQSDQLETGLTLVLNYNEDRAMITHPGAMEHFCLADISWEAVSKARHLHFSSYFLQPGMKKDVGILFQEAKKRGLTTSFDPQWDPTERWDMDMEKILPYVDVFLPNEKELLNLTRKENIPQAMEALKGITNLIVVKRGNQGSVAWDGNLLLHKEPFLNENVVDAIGAGDSFNAGFIYKFLQKEPIEKCMEYGNLIGAISTTAQGGTTAFSSSKNIMKVAKEIFGYAE